MASIYNPEFLAEHLDARITIALEKIGQIVRVLSVEEARRFKLSAIQLQILHHCYYLGGGKCKISDLADYFGATRATVSEAVKVLVKKGYLRKEVANDDARSRYIVLTVKGAQLIRSTEELLMPLKEIVNQLPQKDLWKLNRLLQEIIFLASKQRIIQKPNMCFTCGYYEKRNGKAYCLELEKTLEDKDLRINCPFYSLSKPFA